MSSSKINKSRGADNFGFVKSRFLAKGESALSNAFASSDTYYNLVCHERFTPERLKLTKEYGADSKLWPSKNEINLDKGYEITSGKFIPLKMKQVMKKTVQCIYQ